MNKQSRKFNFTKTTIEKLPVHPQDAKSREQEYSDQQVVGLRVLVSKNGRKFFHLRYSFNGRKRIVSIGEFPALTVQDARKRAFEFKNMVSAGSDPLEERHKQSGAISFKEFGEKEYMPFAKENKKSWKDDLSKLENEIYPAFGRLSLSAVSTRDVQRCLTKIKSRLSASSYNKYYVLISRMFNLAMQWGFLEKNPCQTIKKMKESGGKERYLSQDEIKRLFKALENYPENPSADAIKFLLLTGMRMTEALTLTWDNVDLEVGAVFLEETKAGKSRTVMLNDLAKGVLVDIQGRGWKTDFVFPGKGMKTRLTEPKRVFLNAKKDAGIENLRVHDLRHTYASIAVNNGASLYEVQKLLGHHSSAMTQRYAHLGDKQLKAATDGVGQLIGEAVGFD